jgi:spore coat polysaccharide biosynthesis protein SpsF
MPVNLRLCNEEDVDSIYIMANDHTVRENAFNSNMIQYEEHCKWYFKSLEDKNRIMYIVEDENKATIGQIRLDKEENRAIISYSIEKNQRRKGYGKKVLGLIMSEAKIHGITILEGLVKKENEASRRAFMKNYFIETEEENYFKYTYFVKDGKKS